jgi:acyl-CoA carboxylase subunit beta
LFAERIGGIVAEHHLRFHQSINAQGNLEEFEDETDLELTCPACDTLLNESPLFDTYRICPECKRHFWLPARERLALIVDRASFRETNTELVSVDPLVFRDPLPLPDRMSGSREFGAPQINEALLTGLATIGGREAMIAVVDFAHLGGSIGAVAGEKITLAIEAAATKRIPFVAVCAGGGSRNQEGMLSLVQLSRIANAIGRLRRNNLAFVSVLTHPTIGTVYSGFACHANILLAEPGSDIGLLSSNDRAPGNQPITTICTADELLQHGMLDGIISRDALRDRLITLLDVLQSRGSPRDLQVSSVSSVSSRRATEEIPLARHVERPTARDYLDRMFSTFVELHGDRISHDDRSVIIGLGKLDGVSVAVVATDRKVNNGLLTSAGLRKATRLHRLAAGVELPVLHIVDTPGSMVPEDGSAAALGMAMAETLRVGTALPTPVVSLIAGEAGGAAAISLGAADRTLMLEHAIFSLTGGEPVIGQQSEPASSVVGGMVLSARDCLRLGVVDTIVPEPTHGAHTDFSATFQHTRAAVLHALWEVSGLSTRRLLDERSRKVGRFGYATPESREAVRLEVAQLHEWQRSVGRSLDDLRIRFNPNQLPIPTLPHLPPRPTLPSFQMPERPNLPAFHRPQVNRAEIADLAGRIAATGRGLAERVNEARSTGGESEREEK